MVRLSSLTVACGPEALSLRVIPVLDLMDGVVVRARFGARADYRPIETPLSPDAQPRHVAAGLMTLAAFDRFYVADLDAILGRGDNGAAVAALVVDHPGLEVWVDGGFADAAAARAYARRTGARPVVGSETLATAEPLADLGDAVVLSLDFRADFVGPPDLLSRADVWPRDVIVMTLARVGSDAGPDLDRLRAVARLAGPDRRLFAAGGVRGTADCDALARLGLSGALVASALHDGRLGRPDLARLLARLPGGTR